MKFSVKVRKKYGANVARILAAIPPIMGVWILTGLWHGASWKFVVWGVFHGTLILLSTAFAEDIEKGLERLHINTNAWYYNILQMLKVFILCTIGRVFFRAESLEAAKVIFWRILTMAQSVSVEGGTSFADLGVTIEDGIVLAVAFAMLLMVSIYQEKRGSVREFINQRHIAIRWCIWIVLLFAVILFGKYGTGTSSVFIYDAF